METIHILSHAFEKVNLVTQHSKGVSFDTYKCKQCGLTGKRIGISENILVNKDKPSCPFKQQKIIKVKIISDYVCSQFGFERGRIYDTCDCPKKSKKDYSDAVWVFSEDRKEAVRLIDGEFFAVERDLK